METLALERLERIARNLPIVSKLEMGQVETDIGVVYLAWGKDAAGRYHGVWGCRGVGRPVEFSDKANEAAVRQVLLDDAYWFTNEAKKRGMFEEGFWRHGR